MLSPKTVVGDGPSASLHAREVFEVIRKKSRLLALPTEVKRLMVKNVHRLEDLRNLALTCKELRHHALPRSFEDLRIAVPLDRGLVHTLELLMQSNAYSLRFTRRLSIVCNYERGVGYNFDYDFDSNFDYGAANDGMSPTCGRYQDMAVILNLLVRKLLSMIPDHVLSSFRWSHEFPVGFTTIRQLADKQRKSLRELRMDQFAIAFGKFYAISTHLAVLNCLSLGATGALADAYYMGQLAGEQRSSLRHLEVGTELSLAKRYAISGSYNLKEQREAADHFLTGLEESPNLSVPFNLTSLRLCGLWVDDAFLGDFATQTITRNLKKLGLESCSGSEVFLTALLKSFNSSVPLSQSDTSHSAPKLTSFTFRHEQPTAVMVDSLDKFISSFSGLEELFVLLDKTNKMLHPRCFSAQHGPTLKALVWEGRTAPRTSMAVDTSIITKGPSSADAHLNEICNSCPNLVELGIALDWDTGPFYLSLVRLCHLRTLNIRNLPPKENHDGDVLSLPTFTKAAATQVMERIARYSYTGPRSSAGISLFVIGPTTYEAMRAVRYNGRENENDSDYLQPTFFHVHLYKDITGSWRPLLSEVGKNTVEGVREYTSNLRIFKAYWLR
ncbi:MAG: hypothetical protein M1830_002727 [Pleopsidium flavum]|nr:MAG: hypothetical protein M1830_002727 [Pleopsidium flavum]